MPRLPRVSVPGAIYWVTCRGLDEGQIFKEKADYHMYLDMVAKYKEQHGFRLYAYCLMPDRLELLIEPGENASISEIMHDLNSLYTKYYNGRHEKRGHLFESRFRSVLVEKASELLSMTRHIHWGPSRSESFSGDSMRDYPYSSFVIYRGAQPGNPDISAEIREVTSFLRDRENPAAYEKFVMDADQLELMEMERKLRRGSVYGSDDFKQLVQKRVEEHNEELQRAPEARPNRILLVWVGGIVLLAMSTSVYLYVSRRQMETQYENLVRQMESKASANVLSDSHPTGGAS